jgi:CubicO group peptidase (beta-lactamase class C family)
MMQTIGRAITAVLCGAVVVWLARGAEAQDNGLPPVTPQAARLDAARLSQATALLQQYVSDTRIAGAVAMLARDGRLAYAASVGVQDLDSRTPMSPRTMFRIYSMTKPITAVAVMMLHQEGKFRLDDPVSRYLPEFAATRVQESGGRTRPPSRAITVRDLLLHTSGLNHRTSPQYRSADVRSRAIDLPQFVRNITGVPLMEDPGTRFRYSEATTVLGRLVEVWSGQPFDRFLDERILQPLRMRDTGFFATPAQRPRLAAVYGPLEAGGLRGVELEAVPFTERPALLEGAVGLLSTAPDFLRFAQMLLNGGELDGVRLLPASTVATMVENGLTDDVLALRRGGAMGWGLGNVEIVMKPEALPYPAHRGEYGWDGTAGTIFWVDPSARTVILLFTQSSPPDPDNLRRRFKTAIQAAVHE